VARRLIDLLEGQGLLQASEVGERLADERVAGREYRGAAPLGVEAHGPARREQQRSEQARRVERVIERIVIDQRHERGVCREIAPLESDTLPILHTVVLLTDGEEAAVPVCAAGCVEKRKRLKAPFGLWRDRQQVDRVARGCLDRPGGPE